MPKDIVIKFDYAKQVFYYCAIPKTIAINILGLKIKFTFWKWIIRHA